MKALTIAFKDMLRSARSMFALMFMFVMPVLITAILYFAFGGAGDSDEAASLPITRVQLVNLDTPDTEYGSFSAGETLSAFLQSDDLAHLLQVTIAQDEQRARQTVDRQEADVAIIIPSDLTSAVLDPDGEAAVILYQDPTLTLGPAIVKGLVGQFVDGFAGTKIAAGVVFEQLASRNIETDGLLLQEIVMQYAAWASDLENGRGADTTELLKIQFPDVNQSGAAEQSSIIGLMMASMMIFYVFFTGTATAQSILREEEEGTLPRLFTTPTTVQAILAGKLTASLMTLGVQVAVLMLASQFLFGVRWGAPLPTTLVALATIAESAGFGLFLMSLLKSSKQAGIVYGGVMTVTAMLGGLFTPGVPGVSRAMETISLSMPQGWALRGWKIVLAGGGIADAWLPLVVMAVLAGLFLTVGIFRFRKRFA